MLRKKVESFRNEEEDQKSDIREEMKEALIGIGLDPDEEKIRLFQKFYEMLIETNKQMNLTAITKPKEVVYKHFIDSLSLEKAYESIADQNYRVLDIGTGAGFPSIPLGFFIPAWKLRHWTA